VREEQRQLIQRLAAHDRAASREFVRLWDGRIKDWICQCAPHEKVEEYAQEVWGHLIEGNWLRLLQWKGLYDDDAWHPHSLESFLKRITQNKAHDLYAAEPPELPKGVDPNDIIDRTTSLGSDPVAETERFRLLAVFDRCMRWFKKEDHDAIRLWWEGYSALQIAELIRTNANNVYQRRSYLFRQLRACLAENLPEYFRDV
jgi:DNA-directed RNA polymerase specialized sigma24 family protein